MRFNRIQIRSQGVGNVTNNRTFMNTYTSDELLLGRGKETFKTTDGHSITWISTDLGRSIDSRWLSTE